MNDWGHTCEIWYGGSNKNSSASNNNKACDTFIIVGKTFLLPARALKLNSKLSVTCNTKRLNVVVSLLCILEVRVKISS
jgi:hypothetical protein